MPLHLGPLGDLRRITPLKDVDTSPKRFGGAHTSLSGRRTVDYLGARQTFKMGWSHMPPGPELAWLHALYYRHVRGPLRLLLGELEPNRLSRSAANIGYGGLDRSGVDVSAGIMLTGQGWPVEADPPGIPLRWRGWAVGDTLTLDRDAPCPVLPGEILTGSLWVRSPYSDTVAAGLDHVTVDGATDGATGDAVTLQPGTWTRVHVTATPGTGVIAVRLRVDIAGADVDDTSPALTVAAAQVEQGDTPTAWSQGGGAPLVSVDKLGTSSLYSPLTKPSMTLLEL